MNKIAIAGLCPEELREIIHFPRKFQADQIFTAVNQGIGNINDISTLHKEFRAFLTGKYSIFSSHAEELLEDPDGTRKAVIRLEDDSMIESVLLRDGNGKKTACLSTQAGCSMGCTFCRTGTMGLIRNLTASEIAQQFLIMQNNWGKISHIVFMGMGEPLQNLDELRKSINWLTHKKGQGISPRKITISTCGLISQLTDLVENGPAVGLAISLNSARQDLREKLMPSAKNNSLDKLKNLIINFQEKSGRRITLEYVLIKGVNDRDEDAVNLRKFCRGINYVINLIPWNHVDELDFIPPEEKDIQKFLELAEKYHLNIVRRYLRGKTINGACGQLAVPKNR